MGADITMRDPCTIPTRYWHPLPDGRVQCDACPRACRLREGQRGLCFVRGRVDEQIVLTTYGRSSGFCVDPIEKKPLYHFLPGTPVLSFGTAGCNLACRFCQNWDISRSRETNRLADAASPEELARTAERLGCSGVAFTYNDPVIFMEYAMDVADACHERGIRTIAVSAGYMCAEPRQDFYSHVDAANIDLKAFSDAFYTKVALGHLEPVLDTLRYLRHESKVWLEISVLLIPGLNDDPAEIDRLTRWVSDELSPDVPVHFSAFHPSFRMLDVPPTPPSTLTLARRIALDNGLHHVYTGNVRDREGGTTMCTACGTAVIDRDGYRILAYRLDDTGHCASCGSPLPGHYAGPVGTWGPRRLPVHLREATP